LNALGPAIHEQYELLSKRTGYDVGLFNRDFVRHRFTIQAIQHHALRETHPVVLDVAAGWAVPSRVLAQDFGYRVIAVDSLLTGGKEVLKLTNEALPTVAIWDLLTQPLPIKTESVDVVLFLATIEHLRDSPRFVLEEFHRILKRGGLLFIDTPNILELRKRLMLLLGRQIMPSIQFVYHTTFHSGHHREYTLDDLVKVLAWSKFQVTEARLVDTLSGLSMNKRVAPQKRNVGAGDELSQMTRWDVGFHPLRLYDWAKLPFSVLVKLVPSLRDTLFAVARKE
jgi:ubiquinone/menaquinone biosynthesis C-methylase UbiE